MERSILIAVLVALGGGALIGLQSNFTTISSRVIGPISTGTLAMIGGGMVGIVALVILIQLGNFSPATTSPKEFALPLFAGMIGLIIMSATSFAMPRVGLSTVIVAVLLGQMVIGIVVDTLGLSGGDPIPLNSQRIVGLVVLGVAVLFLIPRE